MIGVNIGKTRAVAVDDAVADYVRSARLVAPVADYLAVNVSSPNTPGLRGLQEIELLRPLLTSIRDAADGVPVLVKIAPDLQDAEVERIAELATELGLAGVIATNTTLSRADLRTDAAVVEAAKRRRALGVAARPRALEVLRILRRALPAESCVISVGGVDTAEDVQARLDAGATLVQGYTAFLYRGPLWARSVNAGLVRIRRTR